MAEKFELCVSIEEQLEIETLTSGEDPVPFFS